MSILSCYINDLNLTITIVRGSSSGDGSTVLLDCEFKHSALLRSLSGSNLDFSTSSGLLSYS